MGTVSWTSGPVILGCGTFGGIGGDRSLIGKGLDGDTSVAVLDEALELGITMLDTAEAYAGGFSEATIGQWLGHRPAGSIDQVRITTKVAPPGESVQSTVFDAAFISRAFAGSLERLGV